AARSADPGPPLGERIPPCALAERASQPPRGAPAPALLAQRPRSCLAPARAPARRPLRGGTERLLGLPQGQGSPVAGGAALGTPPPLVGAGGGRGPLAPRAEGPVRRLERARRPRLL